MATQSGSLKKTAVPTNTYQTKTFDSKKYAVDGYQYPDDLMGSLNSYGNNYVIFYINVNNDSKMLENASEEMTVNIDASDRIKKQLSGQNLSTSTVAIAAIAPSAVKGAIAGATAGGVTGAIVGTITGGAVAAIGVAAVATNASGFSRASRSLLQASVGSRRVVIDRRICSTWNSKSP